MAKNISTAYDQDILGFSVNFTQNKASETVLEDQMKLVKAKSFKSHRPNFKNQKTEEINIFYQNNDV